MKTRQTKKLFFYLENNLALVERTSETVASQEVIAGREFLKQGFFI